MILVFAVAFSCISFAKPECDYKTEVIANGTEFEKENFNWKMRATRIEGKPTNITGTAEILDPEGRTIKSYKPWTNESISKQKTSNEYSPNLKEGEYRIISRIDVECDDTNKGNNIDFKIIKINSAAQNEITIDKNQPKFSSEALENATNNITIKNNTNSNINSANNEITKQNAKQDPTENYYNNVIELKNNEIQKNNVVEPAAHAIKSNIAVYESSNEKSKNLIVFLLLALSVLLNVILIWKR